MADLEKLYLEAKQELSAKHFDRASILLKEILKQDENYKDASRLLAQIIQRKRRRWYSHPWFYAGICIFIMVVAGTIILPGILSKMDAERSAIPLTVIAPQITNTPEKVFPIPTPTSTTAPLPFHWVRINSGHVFARDNIDALLLDPVDPDVLYAGTRHAGVYKSIDGGMSWFPSYTGLARAWIQSLTIDPTNHNILYASGDGIYKSFDGGSTWHTLKEPGGSPYLSIIAIDPTDHNHLYYTDGDWLHSSNDGGATWESTEISLSKLYRFISSTSPRWENRVCRNGK